MSSNETGNPEVYIALASYNGSKFIAEQIDSICKQSYKTWRLLIRDDGSSDGTVNILRSYIASDSRITLLDDAREGFGPAGNFASLMQSAFDDDAAYLMFADQDDVWVEDKIARQLEAMKRVEKKHGADAPILVHSDLAVANEHMKVTSPSFMMYQRIHHETVAPLNTLLTQNFITGCASMINRSLLRIALPIPGDVLMHDWWLALCAAATGFIEYIPEPLVYYRQHGKNVVGAKGFWSTIDPITTNIPHRWAVGSRHILMTFAQARSLTRRLREIEPGPSRETMKLIEEYSSVLKRPRLQRIRAVRRLGIRRQNTLRQCMLYLQLLMIGGKQEV